MYALIQKQNLLLDHTTIGNSGEYGLFYAIPLQNDKNGLVEGCVIYPVDENLIPHERKLDGQLGEAILMDHTLLNQHIPITHRFLYSMRFVDWEQRGLQVKKELVEFAHTLNGKEIPITGQGIDDLFPFKMGSRASYRGWIYNFRIDYEVDPNVWLELGYDEEFGWNIEAVISQIRIEDQLRMFEESFYIFHEQPGCNHIFTPYLTGSTVVIDVNYTDRLLNPQTIINKLMKTVERKLRDRYNVPAIRYQVSIHEIGDGSGVNRPEPPSDATTGGYAPGGSTPPSPYLLSSLINPSRIIKILIASTSLLPKDIQISKHTWINWLNAMSGSIQSTI